MRSPILEQKLDRLIELNERLVDGVSEINDWLALIRNELTPDELQTEVRGFCMPENDEEEQ